MLRRPSALKPLKPKWNQLGHAASTKAQVGSLQPGKQHFGTNLINLIPLTPNNTSPFDEHSSKQTKAAPRCPNCTAAATSGINNHWIIGICNQEWNLLHTIYNWHSGKMQT